MNRTVVIDYGMGNLESVSRALVACGAEVRIAESPSMLDWADRIVLPGVGAFSEGMANLIEKGWIAPLDAFVLNQGKPLLGICLGMQLLVQQGEEGKVSSGLGYIPGMVKRLSPKSALERVPHVGWNEVHKRGIDVPLLASIPEAADFYFVHSYCVVPTDKGHLMATTPYCGETASIIGQDNIMGVQFHPEKSSRYGLQLLQNFLALNAAARGNGSC